LPDAIADTEQEMTLSTLSWVALLPLCAVGLLAQGETQPIVDCVDYPSSRGTSALSAAAAAGERIINMSQPIPYHRVFVGINVGATNEESVEIQRSAGALTYSVSSGPLRFSHSPGEPVVFEFRVGTAYFSSFNTIFSTTYSYPTGTESNVLLPDNGYGRSMGTEFTGFQRGRFAAPMPSERDLSWLLNGSLATARDIPELACASTTPVVKADRIYLTPGTVTTGVRLGSATSLSATALTASIAQIYSIAPGQNGVARASDAAFENVRVDNGVILADVRTDANSTNRFVYFVVKVTNPAGASGFSTNIADITFPCPALFTPSAVSAAFVNTPYSARLDQQTTGVSVEPGPEFFVDRGALPLGLTLSTRGILSGLAQQTGTFPFTIRAVGVGGCFQKANYSLEVRGQFCAADVTAQIQVTLGGFRQNLVTRRWQQTVTLRNNSASSIIGPMALVFDGLSSNAVLFNGSGFTSCAAPLSRPYQLAEIGSTGFLSPGGTATLTVEFTNNNAAQGITYTPRVISGGALR